SSGLEQGHDVRVPKLGRRPGLTQEALPLLRIVKGAGERHFQRHLAVQLRIIGSVHGPEGAGANPGADLEAADHRQVVGAGARQRRLRIVGTDGVCTGSNRRRSWYEGLLAVRAEAAAAQVLVGHVRLLTAPLMGTFHAHTHASPHLSLAGRSVTVASTSDASDTPP